MDSSKKSEMIQEVSEKSATERADDYFRWLVDYGNDFRACWYYSNEMDSFMYVWPCNQGLAITITPKLVDKSVPLMANQTDSCYILHEWLNMTNFTVDQKLMVVRIEFQECPPIKIAFFDDRALDAILNYISIKGFLLLSDGSADLQNRLQATEKQEERPKPVGSFTDMVQIERGTSDGSLEDPTSSSPLSARRPFQRLGRMLRSFRKP